MQLRYGWWIGAVFFLGCADIGPGDVGGTAEMDAGVACVDRDGDGFGINCGRGRDCDDTDASITNDCMACSRPELGCACGASQEPISCFLDDRLMPDGQVMCSEGTRYCKDGYWGRCEDVYSYLISPTEEELAALVDPNATHENCSPCARTCFKITDSLLHVDGGLAGGSLAFADGGGLTLPGTDSGMGMGTPDAAVIDMSATCDTLSACCTTLYGIKRQQCEGAVAAAADDDMVCATELASYCPASVTVDKQPFTIFHELDQGESATDGLELGVQIRNADVYFLLDMTGSMGGERDNLVGSMVDGNVVNCAHLSRCCDAPVSGSQAACQSVVASDDQDSCLSAQATYCGGQIDCPDLDFDGFPDNELKDQGVVGAVRCLVGSAWFGTGYFRMVPYRDYGHADEHTFRHQVDMTDDVLAVRDAIAEMQTNSNRVWPESSMAALHSVLTGQGHYFGVERPAVPDRNGSGCAANHWGYPCFRPDTVPIVVLFTDADMVHGPNLASHSYNSPNGFYPLADFDAQARDPSDFSSDVQRWSASDYQARFAPVTAETFATAHNVGDLAGKYLTFVGDLERMVGDYPASITGCGPDAAAPDQVYRFIVPASGGPLDLNFHLATRGEDGTPATDQDIVMSLFRGVPNSVGAPIYVMDQQVVALSSGPDQTYLTYIGTTDGANSGAGLLGGISGCGADGNTNQVMFTFRPTLAAHVTFDSSESSFGTVLSLHEGTPSDLPTNPSSSINLATNDTFDTAASLGNGGNLDGDYLTVLGATDAVGIDADYDESLTQCGPHPNAADAVYSFQLDSPRRVRIDTEGSSFDTVISLHDDKPPEAYKSDGATVPYLGEMPHQAIEYFGEVTNAAYQVSDISGSSGAYGTAEFSDTVSGISCDAKDSAEDVMLRFTLTKPTELELRVEDGNTSGVQSDQSALFDPVIALYSVPPGQSASADASANTHERASVALHLGDPISAVQTTTSGATLAVATADDYSDAVSGCGAALAAQDQVYSFTPSVNGTVRVEAEPTVASPLKLSVFDGPPPASTPNVPVDEFDIASAAVQAVKPHSACTLHTHNQRLYAVCNTRQQWDAAATTCAGTGMKLVSINDAAEQAVIEGYVAGQSRDYHIGYRRADASSSYQWEDGTGTVTNWGGSEPNEDSHLCAAINTDGTWEDKRCAASFGDSTYFICEGVPPAPLPSESEALATVHNLSSTTTLHLRGATSRMGIDLDGVAAGLVSGCGATQSAPDAVFEINPGGSMAGVTADLSSANYEAVLGVYENSVSGATLLGCQQASDPPLTLSFNVPNRYYLVVTGTATSPAGKYEVKVTGPGAAGGNGTLLSDVSGAEACGTGTVNNPASTDVDVTAGQTYYVVVDSNAALSADIAYEVRLTSLYDRRLEVDNATKDNEQALSALDLGDAYRSKLQVTNTSLSGMQGHYTQNVLSCGPGDNAPDAVYRISPRLDTTVDINLTPDTGLNAAVAVFEGVPSSTPVTIELDAEGNPNEDDATAEIVDLSAGVRSYRGSTASMSVDVDPTALACGAAFGAGDAVFKFTLDDVTEVNIDASASGSANHTYSNVTLVGGYDGWSSPPGGASRIPDGQDTNSAVDWLRNDFDLDATPVVGEAHNTAIEYLGPWTNLAVLDLSTPPLISEFSTSYSGGESREFIEVIAPAFVDLSQYSLVVVDGDSGDNGVVDRIYPLDAADVWGLWWTGWLDSELEPGTLTILLVNGSSATVGQDLDVDNDGVLDLTPWTSIVDSVAVSDQDLGDFTYSPSVLAPDFDGGAQMVAGASRVPTQSDSDNASDWMRNDYDGEGFLAGWSTGTAAPGEALYTPFYPNSVRSTRTTPIINEFIFDHIGVDDEEVVEILGPPLTDLSNYWLVQVDGDGSRSGEIDTATQIALTSDSSGLVMVIADPDVFENGAVTLLLVEDFTGTVGDDLDVNDDGNLDSQPWAALHDAIAVQTASDNQVVFNVFKDGALERPAATLLENDTYQEASANPSPTPVVSNDWLVYDANTGNLSVSTQAQVNV
ncbi:MAG: C-type lectin domain-containing protein, partial [Myxococcales bacterium]|nr:C-type lectin domain-containing protein [Myxococcales bacterium]